MSVMKKSILKRISYIACCVLIMCSFSGCSLIPELSLTQEQNELVAEYAAGLLVKYQIGHQMGLTPLSAYDFMPEPEVVLPTDEETDVAVDSAEIEESAADAESAQEPAIEVQDDNVEETTSSGVPMSDVFGATGFSITPTGYEVAQVYPSNNTEELVFSMQAAPDKELMVIHFEVSNIGEAEAECNLMLGGVKARAIINKEGRTPAQATILDNDLLNMDVMVDAYSSVDGVLVFEVTEGTTTEMTSLDLVLSNAEGEKLYRLI